LLADRTFASLDSVAARMMGQPLAMCVRYLGFWFTDSVSDYLDSKCYKLILQDPDDAIIHNTSSIKTGIATRFLLNDWEWMPKSSLHCYILADALGQPVPNKSKEADFIFSLDTSNRLSDEFIQHFHACIMHIVKCSVCEKENRQTESILQASLNETLNSWEYPSNTTRRRLSSDQTLDEGQNTSDGYDTTSDADEKIDDDSFGSKFPNFNSSKKFSSQNEMLQYYSNIDICHEGLDDCQKAWISISQLASCDGQLLGEAYSKGYDSFRAW